VPKNGMGRLFTVCRKEEPSLSQTTDRASFLALGAAAFMVSADARVIEPLLHVIADQFHTTVGDAAIVSSAYTLPYGLFQLVYGPLGDRIGKLRVMAMALIFFSVGTAACAFVPNLFLFAVLRFLTGMAAAAIIPLSLAYIGDKSTYETRQASLGKFMSALMLGQILSVTIGGIFGQYISWRSIFILFGVISLCVAALLWQQSQIYPEAKKLDRKLGRDTLKPYGELLRSPASRLVVIAVAIEGCLFFGGNVYVGSYLKDRFGLPYSWIGMILTGVGIGGLCYSVSVKKLVKKLGEVGLLLMGSLFLFVAFLGIAKLPDWKPIVPFIVLMGFGFYSMHSTLQTKATEMAPGARGTAVSLFAFCLFVGQSFGVWALGRVKEGSGSYTAPFLISAFGLLTLGLYLRYAFPRLSKPTAPPVA